MIHKLLGKATATSTSVAIEPWLAEGEEIINTFKIWRDEIVLTNQGMYRLDKRGATGVRQNISYVTKSQIIGIEFHNAAALSRTVVVIISLRNKRDIRIKTRKQDQAVVKEMVKRIKSEIK